MKILSRMILFFCLLIGSSAGAETEQDLVKELTRAAFVVDGETTDAILAAVKVFRTTSALRGEGRKLRSYWIAVAPTDKTITVSFVPRTVDGNSLRFKGAISTKVTLRRFDLKTISKELLM